MHKAKPSASKNSRLVIGSPKNGHHHQIPPRKTHARRRVLHTATRRDPAASIHRPALARPLWFCSRSCAAPAARRVDTPAFFVLIVFAATYLKHVGYIPAVVFVSDPSLTRGRVVLDLIPWSNRRAGSRAATGVFCSHCFDCHGLPLKYIGIVGSVATRQTRPIDRAVWCSHNRTSRAADRLFCQI